ncbi:hypothetical protein CEXT_692991 [Caerostris extrusa]|uniref:Uncharacterized protein n=1 Tax=Caerostris extrusa TaxID=172846 RepID=A0AAV4UA27_CAEEX|nr:hypothetical protein CEXT_692991 [Caerostris extrusa]
MYQSKITHRNHKKNSTICYFPYVPHDQSPLAHFPPMTSSLWQNLLSEGQIVHFCHYSIRDRMKLFTSSVTGTFTFHRPLATLAGIGLDGAAVKLMPAPFFEIQQATGISLAPTPYSYSTSLVFLTTPGGHSILQERRCDLTAEDAWQPIINLTGQAGHVDYCIQPAGTL